MNGLSAYVLTKLVEYKSSDADALFEGLEDLGDPTPEQSSVPTDHKPQVATATEAFDSDDIGDLPF